MTMEKKRYFAGFCGSAGLAFGGRPMWVSRIASSADASYMASLVFGFIPLWKSLCSTVFGLIPSFADISDIVKPSIAIISEIIKKILKKSKNFTEKVLTKSNKYIRLK